MATCTFGGKKLQQLRKRRRVSQITLEHHDVIYQKHLSRIETGKTYRPQREKLEDLLLFYQATFNESQEIFKAFGYLPEYPLPNADEIAAIMAQVQPVLDAAPVPAYCVDFFARLHGWNTMLVALSGLDDTGMAPLRGHPVWKSRYDNQRTANGTPDPHLLEDMKQMRRRLAIYIGEPWFDAFLDTCGAAFLRDWQAAGQAVEDDPPLVTPFAARMMHPVSIAVDGQAMCFYANDDLLYTDDRFRIIYLMPADVPTMAWVADRQPK